MGLLLHPATWRRVASGPFGGHATLGSKVISHWRLDETGGTRNDAHASNHLSAVNSPGYEAGKIGNAATFANASSQYLDMAHHASLAFGDEPMAITAWLKPASTGGNRVIVGKWGSNGEYQLRKGTSDRIEFIVTHDGSTLKTVTASTFGALSASTWYFVYAYHDPVANTIGASVNDGAIDTAAHSTGILDSTGKFQIGARNGGLFQDGSIDSVSVWNDILTSGEISALYNSGNGLDY